jgi:plasminogen activator
MVEPRSRLAFLAAVVFFNLYGNGALRAQSLAEEFDLGRLTLGAGIGVMKGEANEYVYRANGSTISRLIWKFDNVAFGHAWMTMPVLSQLEFTLRGRMNFTDDAKMDDWDWGLDFCPGGICHSWHPDTKLKTASTLDFTAAWTILRNEGFSLGLLAGYRFDYARWQAMNGNSNYMDTPFTGLGITYEQWWEAPYIGISASWTSEQWTIGARLIGSPLAMARDEDTHHFRMVRFEREFERSTMWGASARVGYRWSDAFTIGLTYEWQKWDLAKGSTTLTDLNSGMSVYFPNAAGAKNTMHALSLDLSYRF